MIIARCLYPRGRRPLVDRLLCLASGAVTIAFISLLMCCACLPARAHDDDAPSPPSAESTAAAGRVTIAALSLLTGLGVYYGIQRHRLMNANKHPPQWDQKMGRSAILVAILSAALVWAVSTSLSRPVKPVKGVSRADQGARRAMIRGSSARPANGV